MPRLMRLKEGRAMPGVGRRGYGSRVGGCRHRMLKISGRFELRVGYFSEYYHCRPTTSEASERICGLMLRVSDAGPWRRCGLHQGRRPKAFNERNRDGRWLVVRLALWEFECRG